jgi:uncharacterized membrane protein
MILLVLGLALWIAAHAFKRAAPARRGALAEALGAGPARGAVTAAIAAGLVLMVVGFRAAPFVPIYAPPAWTVHLNNLLMLGAVALMGMGRSRGRARSWLRHPMLTGVMVWAVAHLLVNGDLASLLLFGGLGLWAAASVRLINAREPDWVRPEPGPASGDLRLAVITVVVYAVIAAVHSWLGYWPFPA